LAELGVGLLQGDAEHLAQLGKGERALDGRCVWLGDDGLDAERSSTAFVLSVREGENQAVIGGGWGGDFTEVPSVVVRAMSSSLQLVPVVRCRTKAVLHRGRVQLSRVGVTPVHAVLAHASADDHVLEDAEIAQECLEAEFS